jgi:hypothetical protein
MSPLMTKRLSVYILVICNIEFPTCTISANETTCNKSTQFLAIRLTPSQLSVAVLKANRCETTKTRVLRLSPHFNRRQYYSPKNAEWGKNLFLCASPAIKLVSFDFIDLEKSIEM